MLTSFRRPNIYKETIRIVGFLVSITFLPSSATLLASDAGNIDIDKLMSMSLDQLMNINVVLLKDERIVDSPAIVSTYTRDELNRLGLYSLKDFIGFVPGIEVNESLSGEIQIQIRGLAESSNQKVLFLLDGIPYWSPADGDIPLLGIPISAIEKIEVIRGPGSVVHGTNASAGVINVVTREDSNSEFTAQVGSNDIYNGNLYVSHDLGSRNQLSLAIEAQHDNGYQSTVENAFNLFDRDLNSFPEDFSGSYERYEEMNSILGMLRYNGLNVTLHAYESEVHGGVNGSVVGTRKFQKNGYLLHADYEIEKGIMLWNLYTDWNRFYKKLPTKKIIGLAGFPDDGEVSFDNNGKDNVRWRTGVKAKLDLQKNLSWLSGIEYERRGTENYRFDDGNNGENATAIGLTIDDDGSILLIQEDNSEEKSLLTQIDYSIDEWRFVAGIRYVSNSEADSYIAPRASLVYSLSKNSSLKLLYSEGFNSPTFRQTAAIDQLGIPVESDINSEIVKTWDLAYTQTKNDSHFVINIYREKLKDGINLIDGIFVNEDKIYRTGMELDYRKIYREWSLFIGGSYIDEGNERISDDNSARFVSVWLGKLGASYTSGKHSWGASLRSSSKRASVSGYNNLNLNYQYDNNSWKSFLTISNALDEEILFPDVRSENKVVIQVEDNASLSAGITFNF